MKKLILVTAVAGLLTACGTTNKYPSFNEQNQRQERYVRQALDGAPEWMTKLPTSENAIYQSADESGSSMSSAKMFAEAKAYAKICTAAGGKVRSQTKFFETDNGTGSSRSSEIAIRSLCPDVDITGVQTVDVVFLREGPRVRAMVLVALPIGSANVLKSEKEAQQRAPEAFRELDELTDKQKSNTKSQVQPTESDTLILKPAANATLLDIKNPEAIAARNEALKKPGAVVGHVVVR